MKRTYYILLVLLLFFVGCQNDDWKDEIDSIKKELTVQAQLIEQIQKGIYIKSVYKTENGYIIAFSDNREIELTDGQAPLITIGSNGNWYIDGVDTGNSSQGKDGSNGSDGNNSEAPVITIGTNGNWYIDGVDTGRASQGMNGNDGKDAAAIVSIVKTQSSFVFNFSDGSSLNVPFNSEQETLLITGWGDSLTAAGVYLNTLQSLLGKSYQVMNCGVGGEIPATIASRQGGVPAVITTTFTLPADKSPIEISSVTNYRLKNLLYNTITIPLRGGEGNSINPCYINGIECTMKVKQTTSISTDAVWTIQRNQTSSTSTPISANTPVFYYGARAYKNSHAICIWMGQNGGYSDNNQLIDYHKRMIEYNGNSNYVVIGLHTGTAASRATLETAMLKEFGLTYINLREYLSSKQAFEDANLTPTQADLTAIAEGSLPPTFWASSTDKIHLNATGYTLLGKLVYKRFQMLGII